MDLENPVQQNGSSHVVPKEIKELKDAFNREYEEWLDQNAKKEYSFKNLIFGSSRGGNSVAGNGGPSAPGNGGSSTNKGGGVGSSSGGDGHSKARREKTTSDLPIQEIHGFENEILALKHFLLSQKDSDEFKKVAVVGRHGVGKTALCQVIFNHPDIRKAYVPRIWVSMYQEPREDQDPKIAIVKRILKNLGVEEKVFKYINEEAKKENGSQEKVREMELSGLLYALTLTLWGKKYLIVLDDAREEDGWNERDEEKTWGMRLLCGFPKGSGGRVIFTSRDEKLAIKLVLDEENLHRLYPFSDPESLWKIYIDAADEDNILKKKPNEKIPTTLKKDLLNKSGGIPMVARMLAKIEPVPEDEESPPPQQSSGQTGSSHGKAEQKNPEQKVTDKTNG